MLRSCVVCRKDHDKKDPRKAGVGENTRFAEAPRIEADKIDDDCSLGRKHESSTYREMPLLVQSRRGDHLVKPLKMRIGPATCAQTSENPHTYEIGTNEIGTNKIGTNSIGRHIALDTHDHDGKLIAQSFRTATKGAASEATPYIAKIAVANCRVILGATPLKRKERSPPHVVTHDEEKLNGRVLTSAGTNAKQAPERNFRPSPIPTFRTYSYPQPRVAYITSAPNLMHHTSQQGYERTQFIFYIGGYAINLNCKHTFLAICLQPWQLIIGRSAVTTSSLPVDPCGHGSNLVVMLSM